MAPKKRSGDASKSGRTPPGGHGPARAGNADMARATPIKLHDLMARLADQQVASTIETGACLVTDSSTGAVFCTTATADFCKTTLKGTFVGGLCGA